MKVTIQTRLACAASRAWEEVQKPRLLNYVASPLLKFAPLNASGFPEIWEEGDFFVSMFVFGFFPLGLERIGISTSDSTESIFRLRADEPATLVQPCSHHITIRPHGHADLHSFYTLDITPTSL